MGELKIYTLDINTDKNKLKKLLLKNKQNLNNTIRNKGKNKSKSLIF